MSKLLNCPFCGQQDAFVEQLDSDSSVVICQGSVGPHSACLARGPVAVQDSEDEEQPGYDGAIREWNTRAQLHSLQGSGDAVAPAGWFVMFADGSWSEVMRTEDDAKDLAHDFDSDLHPDHRGHCSKVAPFYLSAPTADPDAVAVRAKALELIGGLYSNHGKWLASDPYLRELRALLANNEGVKP